MKDEQRQVLLYLIEANCWASVIRDVYTGNRQVSFSILKVAQLRVRIQTPPFYQQHV